MRVPRAAMGVGSFRFTSYAASRSRRVDYLKVAHEFHTIVLDHIPAMDYDRRNEAKRFIILIDTLYDHAVKLVASAEAEPDALYRADRGFEAHEFKRTASRLIQMRSQSYLPSRTVMRASTLNGRAERVYDRAAVIRGPSPHGAFQDRIDRCWSDRRHPRSSHRPQGAR